MPHRKPFGYFAFRKIDSLQYRAMLFTCVNYLYWSYLVAHLGLVLHVSVIELWNKREFDIFPCLVF